MNPLPPSQFDRRVRHLRVRAAGESDARRAVTLLTDALHTASLPIADSGQILLVRKLALGRISAGVSASAIALQIERAMREVRLEAVSFELPAARAANAVLVPGHAEAIARLAKLHALGIDDVEWFWPVLVPAWRVGLSRGERWLVLLQAAHGLPQAAIAAAAVLAITVGSGKEDELLSALPPGQGAVWLHRAGWNASELAPRRQGLVPRTLVLRHREIVQQWARRWGATGERLVWLAVLLAVAEKPERAGDANLAAKMSGWLESIAEWDEPSSQRIPAADLVVEKTELPGTEPLGMFSKTPARGVQKEATNRGDRPTSTRAGEARLPEAISPEVWSQPKANQLAFGAFTEFAGLLFLIPILDRLGFAEALNAQPELLECDFPSQLLWFIGQRVGLKPGDPLGQHFEGGNDEELPEKIVYPEGVHEILAAPRLRIDGDSARLVWLTAVRRWCRRHARLGLISLIRRPGFVAASLTHIDISFDLHQVDLRVRRLALDVDPGWVPWLGRVVRFHYVDTHE